MKKVSQLHKNTPLEIKFYFINISRKYIYVILLTRTYKFEQSSISMTQTIQPRSH
jgi:hypothetical protein